MAEILDFQWYKETGEVKTPEEIDAAKQDMSERQFRQEFLATFESYENLVAWAFDL